MRIELEKVILNKSNPNKIYGLDQDSIQQFVASINSILSSRKSHKEHIILDYKRNYEEGVTEEIISDYAHYHELDNQYLKQYGIVRIIGILEALIDEKLPVKSQKLPIVEKIKLLNENIDTTKLKNWVKLRNEIVHRPFEHYYPTDVEIEDINDCMVLCLKILTDMGIS